MVGICRLMCVCNKYLKEICNGSNNSKTINATTTKKTQFWKNNVIQSKKKNGLNMNCHIYLKINSKKLVTSATTIK